MRKISFFFLGLVVFLMCSVKASVAFEKEVPLFVDNFTSSNSAVWSYYNGGSGQILFSGGLNLISENSEFFPFVISKNNIFPTTGNFYLKVQFKYLETTNDGVGLGFGNIIPVYGLTYYPFLDSDMVKFQVWQDNIGKLSIDTRRCNSTTDCENIRTSVLKTATTDLNQHSLEIYNRSGITEVYYDGVKTTSSPIINTFWRPTVFWMGNLFQTSTSRDWTDIKINKVESGSLEESVGNTKTIIIPGLGASWDMGAIMSGTDGTSWQVPSFVKVYDGLKNSFINAGYSDTTNPNLFIFPYDWRKPLSVLAERLNAFIDTNIPAGEKVNLIGHSMGGLVARTYAQNYGTSKINKIVTVGSPNMGIVKAYGIWEGATIWDDVWWGKVALDLTTHFGANTGESKVLAVQRLVPSIKDLLPTYDYLKLGDTLLPWASLTQKNDYLSNLNLNASQINSLTTAIYSKDIGTDSLIKVVAHSSEDLDMWVDGKPIPVNPFETAPGDGTVTETSAKGLFTNNLQGTGWHGELITKNDNIQKIFGVLGLDPLKALSGVDESRKKVFVAALRSPGVLEVCDVEITKCNNQLGLYFPNDKLFMLPGYNDENLVVRVTEDGEGAYKLHLGNIDNTSNWTVVSGNLERDDQVDFYNIQSNNQVISATLLDNIPPSVPSELKYLDSSENIISCGSSINKSRGSVKADWGDSVDTGSGLDHYEYVSFNPPLGWAWPSTENGYIVTASEYGDTNYTPTDGVYGFMVRAVDKVENKSVWSSPTQNIGGSCQITFDSVAPTSSIFIQGDLDETKDIIGNTGWFKSFDSINLKIVSGNLSLDKISYQILDRDVSCPEQSSSSYTADHNNTNLASIVNEKTDGIYSLCYFAKDTAGNQESTTHKELLKKDNTNPSFAIDSVSGNLVSGIYYNKTGITTQITVTDPESGYSHVRYDLYNADSGHSCTTYVDWNQDSFSSTTNPITRTLTKSGLADGNYCLRVWVYDNVQNKAWMDSLGNGWIKFTIDNIAPSVNAGNDKTTNALFTQNTTVTGASAYQWSKESGPGIVTFGSATAKDTTISTDMGGTYLLRLTVTDNAGNSFFDEFNLIWDQTRPTVAEITSVASLTKDATPNYTFGSSKAGTISYGGGCSSVTTKVVVPGINIVTFNTLADGTYSNCTVTVTDAADNSSAPLGVSSFTVDTTAPTLAIAIPTAGLVTGHILNIEGTATDPNFNYYYCYVTDAHGEVGTRDPQCVTTWWAGAPFRTTYAQTVYGTVDNHLGSIDFTGLPSGTYQVHLVVYDKAGNSIEATPVSFTLDNTAPTVTINNPDILPAQSKTLTSSASDGTLKMAEATGIICDNSLSFVSYTLKTFMSESDNGKKVCYQAQDIVGNFVYALSDAISGIDTTKPTSIISSPANNGTNSVVYSSSWNGAIAGTATDSASDVREIQLTIQNSINEYWTGSAWQVGETSVVAVGTTNWTYQIGTSLTDGKYTIKSHAIDNAGNAENTYTLTIVLDKTIPEVTISLNPAVADASNGWYKTQPEVTLTATDTNIEKIEYQWNSETGTWATYSAPFKPGNEGAHVLYYRAWDKARNVSGTGVKNIAWDQTELSLASQNVSADPNPTSGSTSKVKWESARDNVGIDKYEIKWTLNDSNNPLSYSKTVGSGTFEVDIDQLVEGRWIVSVRAFDSAGHSLDSSIDLNVDRSGPTTPTLTLAGTGVGIATLAWNAISDAKDYIIWYGNAPGSRLYGAKVGNVTSYTVRGLGAGSYYFIVRAVDEAQNQSAESNEVGTGTISGATGVAEGTPAEGFAPEVLGTETEATPLANPSSTEVTPGILSSTTKKNKNSNWWLLLLSIPLFLGGSLVFKKRE